MVLEYDWWSAIDQGAEDGEILSLKSSDVSHSFTDLTEADTYGLLKKVSATAGGLNLVGVSDSDANPLRIEGWLGATDPTDTTPAIILRGSKLSGNTIGAFGTGETVFKLQNYTTDILTINYGGHANFAGDVTAINFKFTVPGGSNGGLYYYNSTLEVTKWWEAYDAVHDLLTWYHYTDDGSFHGSALSLTGDRTIMAPITYSTAVGSTNRDLFIDDTGLIGYVSSTKEVKTNIVDATKEDTAWLYKLRPRKFDRKDGSATGELGLIAEEVDLLNIPGLVSYKLKLLTVLTFLCEDKTKPEQLITPNGDAVTISTD